MRNTPLNLIVEDDIPVRNFIRTSLTALKYRVLETETGVEAVSLTKSHMPDLILLDLGLPDIDGLEVIKRLREWCAIPIIIVSARGQEKTKVQALDDGADDYLTKPFGVGELMARIRVALRHALSNLKTGDQEVSEIKIKGLRVDLQKRRLFINEREIHLTPIEYKLVVFLASNAGKVLTHRMILKEVWGPGRVTETQYLRVFMANLRRKIEQDPTQPMYLKTEIGVGYRMEDEPLPQ